MGTPALTSASSLLAPARSSLPEAGHEARLVPRPPVPTPNRAALFVPERDRAQTEAFESAVYRSVESRQSLSFRLSQLQARLDGADGAVAGFDSTQLQFSFFNETRLEELALFNRRTDAVGRGIEGPRQQSFFAAREEISARFQLSISISGAALNGFAGAAEGAEGSNELLDRLVAVAEELLGQADELLNGFFSLLDGGDGGFNAESIDALFREFISNVLETLSGEGLPALNLGDGTAGNGQNTPAVANAVQLEFNFEFRASFTSTQVVVEQGDPVVLDLDGDGIELTSYQNGARFDLLGNGRTQQTAFVHGGDAFLALDRNGDGVINSGKELFGEQHGARNGFEELRRYDDNGDGVIDGNDRIYGDLRLFRDNGNGITEAGELLTLAEAGVSAIDLGYRDVDERAAGGNRIAQISSYLRHDGSRGAAADALLNYYSLP